MKNNELVWRELVDAAATGGRRRWENIADLAFQSGVPLTTAAYALRRLVEIGAVNQHHAGFTVVSPDKVLVTLCAARSIAADAVRTMDMTRSDVDRLRTAMGDDLIVGGAGAAIELLGGVNTVSDYSFHVFYLRNSAMSASLPPSLAVSGDQERASAMHAVTFLTADVRGARRWQRHTSFAQTYADLFATPGWQASEFRHALQDVFLRGRDWAGETAS